MTHYDTFKEFVKGFDIEIGDIVDDNGTIRVEIAPQEIYFTADGQFITLEEYDALD